MAQTARLAWGFETSAGDRLDELHGAGVDERAAEAVLFQAAVAPFDHLVGRGVDGRGVDGRGVDGREEAGPWWTPTS